MVKRLVRNGHDVAIWNRSREKTDEVAKEGAKATYTVKELVDSLTSPKRVWVMVPSGDATEAKVFPVSQALAPRVRLAFDHKQILRDAVERAGAELEHSGLATAFVGPTFTLSELRSVYETVWGAPLDAANFRRSLVSPAARFASSPPARPPRPAPRAAARPSSSAAHPSGTPAHP
jgi:8-oxo-dGTP diphosphatase